MSELVHYRCRAAHWLTWCNLLVASTPATMHGIDPDSPVLTRKWPEVTCDRCIKHKPEDKHVQSSG